jgi:hypothetical protein
MSIPSSSLADLRKAIESPRGGFVSIVDDILLVCRRDALHLDWRDERCRVVSDNGEQDAEIEMPLRRSGFRAVLARIAKLCNDQAAPGTFSPYGGSSELTFASAPEMVLRVSWANTLGEQWLTVVPVVVASPSSTTPIRQPDHALPITDESSLQQT